MPAEVFLFFVRQQLIVVNVHHQFLVGIQIPVLSIVSTSRDVMKE
jgi:hypothetical protein